MMANKKRPSLSEKRNIDNDILAVMLAFLVGTLLVILAGAC